MLSRQVQQQTIPQNNNPIRLIQEFAQFKKQMQGKNPQAIINNLLKNGQMTQSQFEQLKQQAHELEKLLK